MQEKISIGPNICHGQPCFNGTRIMVDLVLELLDAGITPQQIIQEYYPDLTLDDIKAGIHYAADLIKNEEFISYKEGKAL